MKNCRERRGFTLAELLVVIAIFGVLAAIAIPVFSAATRRAEEAACLSNRTSLAHQLIYEQMGSDAVLTRNELQEIADESGIKCPSGEVYKITASGEGNLQITVNCRLHSQTIPQQVTDAYQDLLNKNPKETNDDLRKTFYEQNGNAWPILRVDGTDYYIQPYYNTGDTNRRPLIYATLAVPECELKGKWQWAARFIYEPDEQRWYQCMNWAGTGQDSWAVGGSTVEQILERVHGNNPNTGRPYFTPYTGSYEELPATPSEGN